MKVTFFNNLFELDFRSRKVSQFLGKKKRGILIPRFKHLCVFVITVLQIALLSYYPLHPKY
jgi:hypothetical protein